MRVDDFDFVLPPDLIAQTAAPRGQSRLLVLDRATGRLTDTVVSALPQLLDPGDLLVANDTRVFPARLLGVRVPSGGAVECLLLNRAESAADDPVGAERWSALVHPGQKLKPGARVRFASADGAYALDGDVLAYHHHGRRTLRLLPVGGSVSAVVDAIGHIPLPPYIHRDDTASDRERYQTVFAAVRGSVAAPTAGLHFDADTIAALGRAGVDRATITLHVGYGTFKPVRTPLVEDHVVDPEPYDVDAEEAARINATLDDRRRVIAIGTTTTRALEDAAVRGEGRVASGPGQAGIFIYPGFHFQVLGGLMTNFHLPRSSLLMLVSAFAGRERVLLAYRHAVEHRYRFYSYGDAMLIL